MRSVSNRPWGSVSSGRLGALSDRVKEVYKASGGVFNTDQLNRRSGDRRPAGTNRIMTHAGHTILRRFTCSTAPPLTCSVCDESHTVWGQYVDELIQQREINDPDIDHYMLSDLLYRAVALTNASAEIQEACDCDAYGNTIVYEAAGAGGDWFADDARSIYSEDPAGSCCPTCQFIFTGRRFDPETSDAIPLRCSRSTRFSS